MKLKIFLPPAQRRETFRYHRQITHSILLWLGLLWYSLYFLPSITDFSMLLTYLSLGVITHLIGDMLTGSIPWLLYAPYYIRFSRIGITVFLPKVIHKIFTRTFPTWLNENLWVFGILFIINVGLLIFLKMF